jgi:aconitase A
MVGAGLLAKKAVERGLDVKPWVKNQHGARLQGRDRYWTKPG